MDSSRTSNVGTEECADLVPGVHHVALTAGGATHGVRVFVPSNAANGDELPAVLNWHGLGGNGDGQAAYTGFETLAEQEGFVVVHPTGRSSPGLPVLETGKGWEVVDALDTPERDDIEFARALIDDLIADWCADSNRIYSIGMSNGGWFTSTLVCGLSDRIAAAASVAGVYHSDSCRPAEPVPYIAFHGTEDAAVPYDTGGDTGFPEVDETLLALGAVDAFKAFALGAGCEPDPTPVELGDDTIRHDFHGCDGGVPMSFYEIRGDGHTWPGAVGEPTTDDVDATLESWAFFAQHSLTER